MNDFKPWHAYQQLIDYARKHYPAVAVDYALSPMPGGGLATPYSLGDWASKHGTDITPYGGNAY
jgi:hypothetical protein